jgi:hypothetical protein
MPMQNNIADAQYDFMKKNIDMIMSNIKLFWIAMGGKDNIAYNNCQIMLFPDLVK